MKVDPVFALKFEPKFENVSVRRANVALRDLTFHIASARTVLVGGPRDGAGLALEILGGMRSPKRGRVLGVPHETESLLVTSEPNLPTFRSLRQLVQLACKRRNADPSRALDWLGARGASLDSKSGHAVAVRLALIAMALYVPTIRVMLLDEPLAGFDARTKRAIVDALRATDKAFVVATEARALAEWVGAETIALREGRRELASERGQPSRTQVFFTEPPWALYESPAELDLCMRPNVGEAAGRPDDARRLTESLAQIATTEGLTPHPPIDAFVVSAP